MEDDCVCEYDSTWDTESDGDDPAGESQTRRSCQDKNRSSWTLVTVLAFIIIQPKHELLKSCHGVELADGFASARSRTAVLTAMTAKLMVAFRLRATG